MMALLMRAPKFVEEYATKDNRIRSDFRPKNEGSDARNEKLN